MFTAQSPILLKGVKKSVIASMPMVTNQTTFNDMIIPAQPGEFYSYASEFTAERPVLALMKCKSSKSRPIKQLPDLGPEANIFFQFGDSNQVRAHSIKTAHAFGLLDSLAVENPFGETWLATAHITVEEFYEIHSCKDVETLVNACQEACFERKVVVEMNEGSIVAIMTSGGKYGMFLVQEITSVSIQVVACHILL